LSKCFFLYIYMPLYDDAEVLHADALLLTLSLCPEYEVISTASVHLTPRKQQIIRRQDYIIIILLILQQLTNHPDPSDVFVWAVCQYEYICTYYLALISARCDVIIIYYFRRIPFVSASLLPLTGVEEQMNFAVTDDFETEN
jgi:hypothetical protein